MQVMNKMTAMMLTALLLSAPLSTAAQTEPDPDNPVALREAAVAAYRSRDADTALKLYSSLLTMFPDDPGVWFGLSRAHEWSGNLESAIETAERVQQLGFTSRANLSYRLAQLNARAGHTSEALAWIKRALEERYEDRPNIASDDAFAQLHDDQMFVELAAIIPADKMTRIEGLRFDIDYLVEEARRMHAGPARPAHSPRFEAAARDLWRAVPEISDAEFLAGAMKLLAILNDGHSAIYGPDPDTPLQIAGKFLPLKFYWFAEGVYIVDGTGSDADLAGFRVLKFGDLPVEDVLARLSEYRGVDNPMTWKWMGPQFYLGQFQMLQLVGAKTASENVRLTLEDRDGRVDEYEFTGIDRPQQRKLRPSPAASGNVPMYLAKVDTSYWMKPLPENRALYAQFNQVRNDDDVSIAEFADSMLEKLAGENATALIIDVRHNNGGNNYLLRPLIRAMVAFEQRAPGNQIYIISGRNTFSAAQNFLNRAEQWTDAIFVGEPAASKPNFVGEETNLLLPYSRLRGSISTRFWQDSSPGDDRQWIIPAIPVEPAAKDYFANHDAALAAILSSISRAQATRP
jgi:tetratricopeptide (TPR) repeat protein